MSEHQPLTGWRVVVTRPKEQSAVLSAALEAVGAETVEVPTVALVEPADGGAALRQAVRDLQGYAWVVFTSANAVDRFWQAGANAARLGGVKVAAIGTATAGVLEDRGVAVDLVPEHFVAESLAEAFPRSAVAGTAGRPERILLPRAATARDVLPKSLAAKGYEVEVVEAYRTIRPEVPAGLADIVSGADAVCFTSSSTVTGWLELFGTAALPAVVACIGPVTAATARAAGVEVDVEAPVHSIPGLVEALCRYAVGSPR